LVRHKPLNVFGTAERFADELALYVARRGGFLPVLREIGGRHVSQLCQQMGPPVQSLFQWSLVQVKNLSVLSTIVHLSTLPTNHTRDGGSVLVPAVAYSGEHSHQHCDMTQDSPHQSHKRHRSSPCSSGRSFK
jgi:hypothetical protein